jgi:hypothetical protein
MLALVFATRKRSVVLLSLLQSCTSVCRVIERNEIYTIARGKTFLGCRARFCTANLPELLCAVVGADMSSFWVHGGRPRGIVGTWKQAVTQ